MKNGANYCQNSGNVVFMGRNRSAGRALECSRFPDCSLGRTGCWSLSPLDITDRVWTMADLIDAALATQRSRRRNRHSAFVKFELLQVGAASSLARLLRSRNLVPGGRPSGQEELAGSDLSEVAERTSPQSLQSATLHFELLHAVSSFNQPIIRQQRLLSLFQEHALT
jgi:hypothetical protein